jgi:ParB family chromosome partitioning protein
MALGRGLGAILGEIEEAYANNLNNIDDIVIKDERTTIEEISVSLVDANPYQPRKYFDQSALQELSESIKQHGLLQPIVVVRKENGFLLVAGERRLRAHKLASIENIKAIVVNIEMEDIRLRELALIENIQREDLNSIELGISYAELLDVHNITHEELSLIVHKSRSQITNTIRLLSLHKDVQDALVKEKITQGHAKILVSLDNEKQLIALNTIIGQKLTVRDTELMIKGHKKAPAKKIVPANFKIEEYSKSISEILKLKHKIKANKLEILFENKKDIENFIELLKK